MDGGIAPYVCHHMTFKIYTAEAQKTIYCSSVKSVRDPKYPNQCGIGLFVGAPFSKIILKSKIRNKAFHKSGNLSLIWDLKNLTT